MRQQGLLTLSVSIAAEIAGSRRAACSLEDQAGIDGCELIASQEAAVGLSGSGCWITNPEPLRMRPTLPGDSPWLLPPQHTCLQQGCTRSGHVPGTKALSSEHLLAMQAYKTAGLRDRCSQWCHAFGDCVCSVCHQAEPSLIA